MNEIELAQTLIRYPSITPQDKGVIDYVISTIEPLGFKTFKYDFDGTVNLYARYEKNIGPNFCFAGHTDVVSPGDYSKWSVDPFKAEIINEILVGRGAVDMKGAIAAFIAASNELIKSHEFNGSISIILTGDEEADSKTGMIPLLRKLEDDKVKIDVCLVGEPTNTNHIGDTVKIGRRGSINFELIVNGTQGHVAYPELASNPIDSLIDILYELKNHILDSGNEEFIKSNLEITSIDIGNPATNIIPQKATAKFNIRFNNLHNSKSLIELIKEFCNKITNNYELNVISSSESFISESEYLKNLIVKSIKEIAGKEPELSTSGGTSDARFIKDYFPVIEFGLTNKTAHKTDEQIKIKDITILKNIYLQILKNYFEFLQ